MSDEQPPDNVVPFAPPSHFDIPPNEVLNGAMDRMVDAVVVGWDEEGTLYFATSMAYKPDMLWLLELAKMHVITLDEEA